MPRRRIPQVIDGQLTPLDAASASLPTIAVGSTAWHTWLADPASQSFAFRSSQGTFTARRERREGSWYWYAYRTQSGQLRKEYLGKPAELTLQRLQAVAARLAEPAHRPPPTNQRSTSDKRRPPTADGHPLIRNTQHATLLATKQAHRHEPHPGHHPGARPPSPVARLPVPNSKLTTHNS